MKLDLSMLDCKRSAVTSEAALPVLDGADLDAGTFAMPAVKDVRTCGC